METEEITETQVRARWVLLSHSDQQTILDKHRYEDNHGHDWWEDVYENFRYDMEQIGIRVDRIYFSGFASQGDGACFEGAVNDWKTFLEQGKFDGWEDFLKAYNDENNSCRFSVMHSGRYYHEYCTSFTFEPEVNNPYDESTELVRYHAQEAFNKPLRDEDNAFEGAFIEYFKDLMRNLYKRLDEENDYLNSDEVILEGLISNEELWEEMDELENDE